MNSSLSKLTSGMLSIGLIEVVQQVPPTDFIIEVFKLLTQITVAVVTIFALFKKKP